MSQGLCSLTKFSPRRSSPRWMIISFWLAKLLVAGVLAVGVLTTGVLAALSPDPRFPQTLPCPLRCIAQYPAGRNGINMQ